MNRSENSREVSTVSRVVIAAVAAGIGLLSVHAPGHAADPVQARPANPPLTTREARHVEEAIGRLKDLINRNHSQKFFEYVALQIPSRFYHLNVPTRPVVAFYVELWEGRTDRHPDLNWEAVERDEFRHVIARTLSDEVRDGRLRYDTTEVRAYLRSITSHDDEIIAGNALMALDLGGKQSLIPRLTDRVSQADLDEFRIAVRMLAAICLPEARQSLDELAESEPSDQRKQYVVDAVDDFYGPDGRFYNCRY